MNENVLPELVTTKAHFIDSEGNPSHFGINLNSTPTSEDVENDEVIKEKCKQICEGHEVENLLLFIPLSTNMVCFEYYDGILFPSSARSLYKMPVV